MQNLVDWMKRRMDKCLPGMMISLSIQFFTLPLVAYYYYEIPVYAILLNIPVLALIAVSGSVCAVAESFLWGNSQFYVGNYITVFAMFLYALKFPDATHPVLLHIGRDLSVYVYLFHIAVGKAFDFLGSYAGFWGKDLWYILRPPAVLAGALLFAELIFRGLCLIKKKKMPIY